MCGIAGIFESEVAPSELPPLLERMADSMLHRGPDDRGIAAFPDLRAGLACRRLSIVDLVTGHQPIAGEDGNVVVVMNGEIYNHRELRAELESRGHRFRSSSDTETVVHLYEDEGLECLARLNGMFGLAILDVRARRLVLARDAAGMKTLYWTRTPSGFLFASEVKALLASRLFAAQPDWEALDSYLAFAYVPAPMSCFRGVEKVPAGEYVILEEGHASRGVFWRPRFEPAGAPQNDQEYAAELEVRLRAAVKTHLDADVPVGAFVSGGWDSSLVAALAAEISPRPLRTFSLVFPEDPDLDESHFSRQLATHLGTEHQEVEFRAADVPATLACAIGHLEEPCTTAPALLDFRLASVAGRVVKSVVGGEGSDELFAGYLHLKPGMYYRARRVFPRPLARAMQPFAASARLARACAVLSAPDDASADIEWFRSFTRRRKDELLLPHCRPHPRSDGAPFSLHPETLASCTDLLERRLAYEFTRRLPDGILFCHDKMTMAHSLELRMPFLDRGVIDFALALPSRMKWRGSHGKYVLSLLASRLPPEIARRRKFGLHYSRRFLLAATNQAFVRELLLDSAAPDGLFRKEAVERLLGRYRAKPDETARFVWLLVFLQSWWNEFFRPAGGFAPSPRSNAGAPEA
jgi:asparagine synthase (glutamine-hydrolysing)